MKKKINKYSKHELLDRSCLIMCTFDNFIINHQSYEELPKRYKKKVEKIHSLLYELYCDSANL